MSRFGEQTIVAPLCGRCFKPVESAVRYPLIENNNHIGWMVEYRCHGETIDYRANLTWFDEPGNDSRPFMQTVFTAAAPPMQKVDSGKLVLDHFVHEMHEKHRTVASTMSEGINQLAKSLGHADTLAMLRDRKSIVVSVPLVDLIQGINNPTLRYTVLVDKKPVGEFVVSTAPESPAVTWSPIEETPKS